MAMWPCRNSACNSYGKPHPNCKCPQPMAEGGVVGECRGPHQEGCEYHQADPRDDGLDFSASLAHLGAAGLIDHQDLNKHFQAIRHGHKRMTSAMDGVFDTKSKASEPDEKRRDKVDEYLKQGGISQDLNQIGYEQNATQAFAHGGQVDKAPTIAEHLPVHNVLLHAAKGRIANYLNTLRPSAHSVRLPFDDEPQDAEAKRQYHRAIDVANDPLSVLSHIPAGTIEPEHMKHLSAVAPELADHLQKGLTERIVKAQLKGEKPPYKIRQGLSLFMGAPLSSEMTPTLIQAAQATFAGTSQPPDGHQPPAKAKGGNSSLSKSDEQFLTGDQAVMKRGQAQKR